MSEPLRPASPAGLGRRRCLPCPAGHVLELALAIGLKGAAVVVNALLAHPRAERVAIVCVGPWDAGVTVAFDVVQQSAEPLLPQALLLLDILRQENPFNALLAFVLIPCHGKYR